MDASHTTACPPHSAFPSLSLSSQVQEVLRSLHVGRLSEADVARRKAAAAKATAARIAAGLGEQSQDPYSTDPPRHPALIVRKDKPFNAEPPMALLAESFLTPEPLFYVRHHHPVPVVDARSYRLKILSSDSATVVAAPAVDTTRECGAGDGTDAVKLTLKHNGKKLTQGLADATGKRYYTLARNFIGPQLRTTNTSIPGKYACSMVTSRSLHFCVHPQYH
jgi:hypothetical protein